MNVKDILEHLGYKVHSYNEFWRMNAIYRDSNSLSLSVNKNTGWYSDFVTGESGPLHYLISTTLGISRGDAEKYLKELYYNGPSLEKEEKKQIKNEEVFNNEFLKDLLPSYSFYKKRGISEETLKLFNGGVKTYGKLNNRFVFPVFDKNKRVIGISGRDLFSKADRPKWKTLGKKNNFVYPFHITESYIKQLREVILVESIGDALSLYEAGIYNFLVLFGTSISNAIILYLIELDVDKIIVATNNDFDSQNNWGEKASDKIVKKLSKFFDLNKIEVRLPTKKDFGEMKSREILDWANKKTPENTEKV